MSQTFTITTDEHRARNIAIGFVVIVILTWWQITGSLPLLASSMIPDHGKVSSVQSFIFELLTDGLYLVGTFTTAILSGIWSLGVSLLQMLISKTKEPKSEPAAVQSNDQIFLEIEKHLNQFDERIEKLEFASSVPSTPVSTPKRRSNAVKS